MRKTRTFYINETSITAVKVVVDNGTVKTEPLKRITCVGILTNNQVLDALRHTYGDSNYAVVSVDILKRKYTVNVMDLLKIATPVTEEE